MDPVGRHVSPSSAALTDAAPETEWVLQYRPRPFAGRAGGVAAGPRDRHPPEGPRLSIIPLNLPTTVEGATPMSLLTRSNGRRRLHQHRRAPSSPSTRTTTVAPVAVAELALQAGADRVRGPPLRQRRAHRQSRPRQRRAEPLHAGRGPGLDFSDIDEIRRCVEHCNQLPVHLRHPYAGDLVHLPSFRLAPGRHQRRLWRRDARVMSGDYLYLPIDPKDLGRSYDAVIP